MKASKIAVVGYSTRLPQTSDARFWADLIAGRNLLTEVAADRWAHSAYWHPERGHTGTSVSFSAGSLGDVAGFDAGFFRISPREAAAMDPQQRLLLEMSWEALSHAGAKPATLRGKRCGVFIGLASIDYGYRQVDDLACIGPNSATGSTASIAANRLSYFYDWRGPSLVIDTACSSGLVAFHQACRSLLSGESDVAVTGAINLHLHPFGFVIFSKASMLSASGKIRPFQAGADGYVRSEGGGVFVLKSYEAARRDGDRILAVVAHSAINADGYKSGLTVPSVEAQAALLREAYEVAGIAPDNVDYLEAHGTGTAVGDPIEVEAIGQALGQERTKGNLLPIGSVKSNLGHLETASAVPSLLKAIHCLHRRRVPPTIGIEKLNPNLPLERYGLEVVTQTRALPDSGQITIGVNSFGFGGANAHVILQSPPRSRRTRPLPARKQHKEQSERPLMLSAATGEALRQSARDLREAIAAQETSLWEASLYQLNFRRERLTHRALLWARDRDDLLEALDAFAERGERAQQGQSLHDWHSETSIPNGIVWVFSGNGCQWAGMGQGLLEDTGFARAVDAIDETFEPLAGYRLRDELQGLLGENRYALTQFAQPALFALQVGQTIMLREHGLEAAAVVGHSVGEVAAAWACGALSLADATRVVYFRSHEQERTRGHGQMTAVAAGADAVAEWLSALGLEARVQIAALNSQRGSTVVGEADALAALETSLRDRGVPHKRLPLDYPFHGPHMDALRGALLEQLADLAPREAAIPFISTVTGTLLSGEALDADYWWRNVRAPVYFSDACAAAAEYGELFVELGGHPVLRGYIQENLSHRSLSGRVIETLSRDRQAQREAMREAAGALWIAGVPPQWDRYFPQTPPFVDLPHYPWERERHWHAVTPESAGLLYRYPVHPLLGYPVAGRENLWEQHLDTATSPWLADHRVGDGAIFPGAGYVELMLAAGAQNLNEGNLTGLRIESLEIMVPMLLEHNVSKILRTRMADDGSVEIHSRPQLGESWVLHAKGRVGQLTGTPDAPFEPLESGALDHAFDKMEHYALAEAAGLHYGPAFRTVANGGYRCDYLWGHLSLSDTLGAESYLLHPTLLDGAFQLLIDRLAEKGAHERGWGFVPVRLEQLSWYLASKTPVEARVYLLRRSPQSFLAEVQLLDADGQVCVTCKGVRMRRLRLRREETERLRLFRTCLRSQPRQEAPSPIDADSLTRNTLSALAEADACRLYSEEYGPLLATYLQLDARDAESADTIDAEALWQTLLQDYPDLLPWTLAAGRRWLAAEGGVEGNAPTGDELTTGYRRALELPVRDLAAVLSETLGDILKGFADANLLDVLELTDGLPELLPRLSDAHQGSRLGLFHVDPSRAEPCDDCVWRTFGLASAERLPPLDLIWAHLDARDAEVRDAVLDLAETALRPGGWLLLSGLEPEVWWLGLGVIAEGACSDDALEALSERRLISAQVLRPEGSHHWLLLAQCAAPTGASVQSVADWLLVGMAQAEAAPLAQALRKQNQNVRLLSASTSAELTASLNGTHGCGKTDNILYYLPSGLADDESPAAALGETCERLRRLGLWALSQNPVPRLDLLLPGALSKDGEALLASGVAGFARTLMNEWPGLNLRLLDASLPANESSSADTLLRELLNPDAERELRLDDAGGRYVVRVEETTLQHLPTDEAERPVRRLSFSTPGQLRHLAWSRLPAAIPGPHEVEVEVSATGLNFRDVMYTLGLLSDEALENGFSGPTLGLEFAGTITVVGEQVESWATGDRVLGFAPASFSNRLITLDSTIARLPRDMSFIEGATVPTVFFTAWYALRELGRLQAGERLLVHGGAGGVGIAAIQIAQQVGAEVFATAGSPAKRDFLRLLGVKYVYDSRMLDFADEILRDTNGEGVDTVLNSLAGEAMRKSLQLLKPFGRFLELGKRDFYADTALGLRPMRNNLSYFGIDADQMMVARPELTQHIFQQCLQSFNGGALFPLPATVFPSHGVVEAFRHMQQSRQIGKIVVDMEGPYLPEAPPAVSNQHLKLKPDGVYLITGGTSGLGLETALRLAQRGARKLVLVSRSGRINELSTELEALRQLGIEPHVRACDVSDAEQLRSLLAEIAAMGPLRGIVHAAAVIEDALAENLNPSRLRQVLAPKVDGAWHLHRLTQDQALDFFVVYSSIANLLGNVGQAAYLAANGWMESLVDLRRSRGLPATALQFGPIADTGFLTRNDQTLAALEKRIGGASLSASAALDALEAVILEDADKLAVADLHWGAIRRYLPLAATPKYAELDWTDTGATAGLETGDWLAHLMALTEDEATDLLGEWIVNEVGQILRLAPEKIDRHRELGELGFDSLMGMELALALEDRLNFKVPTFVLSEEPTVHKLAQRLLRELLHADEAGVTEREMARLVVRHGVDAQEYKEALGVRED